MHGTTPLPDRYKQSNRRRKKGLLTAIPPLGDVVWVARDDYFCDLRFLPSGSLVSILNILSPELELLMKNVRSGLDFYTLDVLWGGDGFLRTVGCYDLFLS